MGLYSVLGENPLAYQDPLGMGIEATGSAAGTIESTLRYIETTDAGKAVLDCIRDAAPYYPDAPEWGGSPPPGVGKGEVTVTIQTGTTNPKDPYGVTSPLSYGHTISGNSIITLYTWDIADRMDDGACDAWTCVLFHELVHACDLARNAGGGEKDLLPEAEVARLTGVFAIKAGLDCF